MATDRIEKLTEGDAFMLEKLVDTINQLIDYCEYLDKRQDRHWQFHRMKEKEERDKDKG